MNIERLNSYSEDSGEMAEMERKENEPKAIQRLELDPEKGQDIVIKNKKEVKITDLRETEKAYISSLSYDVIIKDPIQILVEENGKVIENLEERVQNGIYFYKGGENKMDWRRVVKYWSLPWGARSLIISNKKIKEAVLVPIEESQDLESIIFCFVHELGHSIYEEKDPKFLKKFYGKKVYLEYNLEKANILYETGRSEKISKKCKDLCVECFELQAQIERNAWAEGLRFIRELKRDKGIDLLKPFRKKTNELDWDKLDKIIHRGPLSSLGSYECFLEKFIEAKIVSEELKGMFTKKYYKEKKTIEKLILKSLKRM